MLTVNETDEDVLSLIREVQVTRPSDLVVEQLLKLINRGNLKPGDLLPPERELTKRFGISRNYVRDGIKTLELYGLLKPIQGKGTVVTDSGIRGLEGMLKTILKLTRSDLLSLVDTRILLETETARLAAEKVDADARDKLKSALEELRRNPVLMNDIRLHIMIADLSLNSVMASLIRLIVPDIILYYRDLGNDDSIGTFDIHQKIVESMAAGNANQAGTFMREHLLDSRDNFIKALERRKSARLHIC